MTRRRGARYHADFATFIGMVVEAATQDFNHIQRNGEVDVTIYQEFASDGEPLYGKLEISTEEPGSN